MKRFFNLILIATAAITIVVAGIFIWVMLNQEKLMAYFVESINSRLNVRVEVQKMDVTFLSTFPDVAIRMKGIQLSGNDSVAKIPLLDAEYLDFRFDFWSLWNQQYTIKQISIQQADVYLSADENGENNYSKLFKTSVDTVRQVDFNLEKCLLRDVSIQYESKLHGAYSGVIEDGNLVIRYSNGSTMIQSSTDILMYFIKPERLSFFANTPIRLEGFWVIENDEFYAKDIRIDFLNSSVTASFSSSLDSDRWLLKANTNKLSSSDVDKVMPGVWTSPLSRYQMDGNFNVDLIWQKKSKNDDPSITMNFIIKEGAMLYPEADASIDKMFIRGQLKDSPQAGKNIYSIKVDSLAFNLVDHLLYGSLEVTNLESPNITTKLKGSLPAMAINPWIDKNKYKFLAGELAIDVLFNRSGSGKYSWEGEIGVDTVTIALTELNNKITFLKGNILFNNDDVAASDMHVEYKEQFISGNVVVYNVLNANGQDLRIQGLASCRQLDAEKIMAIADPNRGQSAFNMPQGFILGLKVNVEELIYKKHRHKEVSMAIYADSSNISIENLRFNFAGGNVGLEAFLEKRALDYRFNILGQFERVSIDSIFYVQDDFNQSFISYKHLQGRLTGNFLMSVQLDSSLKMILPTMVADVRLSIDEGRLSGFEPMKKLSKFADEASLADIRFQNLSNEFHIENSSVFIPEMVIRSNIREITISGIHGFDNKIDYRLKVPLSANNKKDPDEVFGAIETEEGRGTYLFLKVTGTGENPEIDYDKKAVKQKVKERLKEEKKEFLQLFKPRIDTLLQKPKKVELEEDVYFDFD